MLLNFHNFFLQLFRNFVNSRSVDAAHVMFNFPAAITLKVSVVFGLYVCHNR